MKKFLSVLFIAFAMSTLLSSCYSHKFVIGEGAKQGVEVKARNNFFIYGLVPGDVSDPQKMAGGAKNFEVTEVITFVDGLLSGLTLGIYTPTTTIVRK
jgi:hypothetical protein